MKISRRHMRRVRRYGKWAVRLIQIAQLLRDLLDAANNYRRKGIDGAQLFIFV